MSQVKFNYAKVNAANVDALIKTAIKSVNTMQKAVQYAAVSVLMSAKAHGDYSKANELVKALGTGVRSKALVEFFVVFGKLTVDSETPSNGFNGWAGKDAIDVDGAKDMPWWELKPEPIFKGFSLDAELAKLIKRAQSAQEDAVDNPDHADKVFVDVDKLVKLLELAS